MKAHIRKIGNKNIKQIIATTGCLLKVFITPVTNRINNTMQTITAIAKPSKVSPTLLELFYGLSSIKTENVVYVQKDLHYSLRANE